jgi:hypothetical protein
MHEPYGLPPLFAVLDPVWPAQVERVIEYEPSRFKADRCFLRLVLFFASSQTNFIGTPTM